MTTIERLLATKAILTPEVWTQKDGGLSYSDNKLCLAMAFAKAGPRDEPSFSEGMLALCRAIDKSLTESQIGDHVLCMDHIRWNDAQGRTLEQVHAKIDEAIALLRQP